MRGILILLIFFTSSFVVICQPLNIQWQKCFGGTLGDAGYSIKSTNDGGYLVGGFAISNDGNVSGSHGLMDYWVIKLDSSGGLIWQKCYGGSDVDQIYSLQLADQGFILAGFAGSIDGDIIGMHLVGDAWVVKCDTSGNIVWQKCLGGSDEDGAYDLIRTYDQGFAVFGYARSTDFDVVGRHYNPNFQYASDAWLVKLDTGGNIQWSKCYGGDHIEEGYSIVQTKDSGYVIVASTMSDSGDIQGWHGSHDYWVVKINSIGSIEWQKCLGGSRSDIPQSIIQTFDDGYLVTGYVFSDDFDVTGHHGATNIYDSWVVKLDSNGNIQWEKSLGGSNEDYGDRIIQLSDSGYLAVSVACSIDGDLLGNPPSSCDIWIVKMDQAGNIQWQQCMGGSCDEEAFDIELTPDGGAIFTGATCSNDGDVSGNHGNYDVWVVKLGALPDATSTFSNPITDFKCYFNHQTHSAIVNFYLDKIENINFNLLDLTGRILLSKNFKSFSGFNKTELNTPDLANGIYVATLITSKGFVSKKVFVNGF